MNLLQLPRLATLAAGVLCTGFSVRAEHWPAWRGESGTGVAHERNLPLTWGIHQNVRWRTPLPERGNSTPIVWADRVFITQSLEAQHRRALLCFDRATGRLLWQQGVIMDVAEPTHETNPQGSSSPVTDGERVVAWFGSAGVYCYDFQGREMWRRELGPQRHIWGWGASPMLQGDFCYLNFGPGVPSFLVALDKRTGRERWRVTEPNADSGEKAPGQEKPVWAGSWSTPIVVTAGGREELVLSWPKRVIAFEPKTGRELWSCAGLNPLVYTSPLYDREKEIVVAMGGYSGMSLAVKAGGTGDVTDSHRLWHHAKTKQRIGSGVIRDGHVYILNDPGVAECFELETGKLVWEERLRGPAAKSDNWSSMITADGKLFAINQGGDAFVLQASPRFEVLATNSVGETTIASPAASDGDLFIRTHEALWCFRKHPAGGVGPIVPGGPGARGAPGGRRTKEDDASAPAPRAKQALAPEKDFANNLAGRLLRLESQVYPVTDEMYRTLQEVVQEAGVAVGKLPRPAQGGWDRAYAKAVLTVIDAALIQHGFVHPDAGSVDLLAGSLSPFQMTAARRPGFERLPCNRRRTSMIDERFPGPFHAVDCDTASFLYLAVAEQWGLPLCLAVIPASDRRAGHTFVRWRQGAHFLNWETLDGVTFSDEDYLREWNLDRRVVRAESALTDLTADQVLGCGHYLVALQYGRRGEAELALHELGLARQLFPQNLDIRREFAWLAATAPGLPVRPLAEATEDALKVVRLLGDSDAHDTLAATYAAAGKFDVAVKEERTAISISADSIRSRPGYRQRLRLYQQRTAYQQPSAYRAWPNPAAGAQSPSMTERSRVGGGFE